MQKRISPPLDSYMTVLLVLQTISLYVYVLLNDSQIPFLTISSVLYMRCSLLVLPLYVVTHLTPMTQQHSVVQKNEPSAILPGPKHVFYCQLAHGSPTGIISAFTNTKELYQKIADCYDISLSDVSTGHEIIITYLH